jgi:hypothetical protein
MPACPRDSQYSSVPPPGFTGDRSTSKNTQLVELLEKVTDKYRRESHAVEQQSKQTSLLIAIMQYTLLADQISNHDRENFLQNMITIANDLLADDHQNIQTISSNDSGKRTTIR